MGYSWAYVGLYSMTIMMSNLRSTIYFRAVYQAIAKCEASVGGLDPRLLTDVV